MFEGEFAHVEYVVAGGWTIEVLSFLIEVLTQPLEVVEKYQLTHVVPPTPSSG